LQPTDLTKTFGDKTDLHEWWHKLTKASKSFCADKEHKYRPKAEIVSLGAMIPVLPNYHLSSMSIPKA
jgi:hypothetical protein